MNQLIVALYGVFLVAAGLRRNGGKLLDNLTTDVPAYLPWLIAIIALALLSQNDDTKKIAAPFIILVSLNFVLRNFETIQSELTKIYNMAATPTAQG